MCNSCLCFCFEKLSREDGKSNVKQRFSIVGQKSSGWICKMVLKDPFYLLSRKEGMEYIGNAVAQEQIMNVFPPRKC